MPIERWGVALPAILLLVGASVRAADEDLVDLDALRAGKLPEHAIWLETLDLRNVQQDWGAATPGKALDGKPLRIHGQEFAHGIGTHAHSEMLINLKGAARRFVAYVGVLEERAHVGSVAFEVEVDGEIVVDTGTLSGPVDPVLVSVPLRGAERMVLRVTDGGNGIGNDHAVWGLAALLLDPAAADMPVAEGTFDDQLPVIAVGTPAAPAVVGPRIVGCGPGHPFLFRIPATGQPPLTFQAERLPAGLSLDATTGIITGAIAEPGSYDVLLKVSGPAGEAQRKLRIECGRDKLALTPPMGWNSWNVWGTSVDAEKVRAAADWMVKSGLAAHGYQYINIDDAWEGERDADGVLQPNEKFGDMKALADYVHSLGLKLGIYSSPGPQTCAGFAGSYMHEKIDADTWARWGIDYLKYDWCSYGQLAPNHEREELMKPYRVMRAALDSCGRDIVYSLCQYGMGEVWEWGGEVGGNLWRTTGDITDTWNSMSTIGFGQHGKEAHAGPGRWNDPDMLVVGKVGWGPTLRETRLSPHEQLTHISLWSILAAPLLIGCDMSQLEPFTVAILSNDEVLAVNQDPLGIQGSRKAQEGELEVWSRPLWDGTLAVGLFNRGRTAATVTARWTDLGLESGQLYPVRDLWRKQDLGEFSEAFAAEVPRHGVVLVKIGAPREE